MRNVIDFATNSISQATTQAAVRGVDEDLIWI